MSTEYVEASGIGATYELMESISKMRKEQCKDDSAGTHVFGF